MVRAALILLALAAGPVLPAAAAASFERAMPARPEIGTPSDEIDATGSLGPTDPFLVPDYDGPEIDVDRPRRDPAERAIREFIPE
ncbi:hypothetical protein M446_2221 [Methylobacterium sp. 4-46]|uniref:hypothetical protein n=1 Tax=unclassified Methylobacterium TaxID=2615210 RepID=UPI000152DBE3|nr:MULTISPECIES: hypothetical protein [Methylobacterium]ACA16682.1 hypothetical protein M446_2221 [Methylobacterium sp. 4-46]WFT82383.1 hypothetical protein QA634_11255 [Methylobacterium nodulans]